MSLGKRQTKNAARWDGKELTTNLTGLWCTWQRWIGLSHFSQMPLLIQACDRRGDHSQVPNEQRF